MRPKKHSLTTAERTSVSTKITERLSQILPEIMAAYIFGSFVGQDSFRDIDIGILLSADELAQPLAYELNIENLLEKEIELPVDVRVLNGAPLSFQQNVIQKGLLIVDKDPNRRAAFEGNVRKQYFDFSRFRRRYLKEIAHA